MVVMADDKAAVGRRHRLSVLASLFLLMQTCLAYDKNNRLVDYND